MTETTRPTAQDLRREGFTRAGWLVAALVAILLLFLSLLGTAETARANTGDPAGAPTTAPGVPAPALDAPPAAAVTEVPADGTQQAATDQGASADATASQPEQSNVVIVIRINSPGDDVIYEANGVAVAATTSNESSTAQEQAPAGASTGASEPSAANSAGTPAASGSQSGGAAAPSGAGTQPAEPASPSRSSRILRRTASSAALSPPRHGGGTNRAARPRHQMASGPPRSARPSGTTIESASRLTTPSHAGTSPPRAHRSLLDAGAARGAFAKASTRVVSWLGGARSGGKSVPAAVSAGEWNLGLLTLVALLTGVVACAAMTWLPQTNAFLLLRGRG